MGESARMVGNPALLPEVALQEAQAALEHAAREIAELKAELTREAEDHRKTERQLELHAEALARSNQELEQFAYAASHDLQAPLRSITGFSQLLMKHSQGKLDPRCEEYLEYIESSARHLHLLINDLLEFSRVGRGEARMGWVESGEAVRHALRVLAGEMQRRNAAVLHANLPRVRADAKMLAQLFQNLIGNALKYSRDDRAPEVRITAEQRGDEWEFAVRDNGIGMEPHETTRIFTIFQRLHTLDKYEGTGIGLSICRKIVERHGGRIWAESKPGQGSTFRFTLSGASDARS